MDKYGRAKKNELNVAKINTMIKARKTVNKVCKVSDTKAQKLRKCFDYIAKVPYRRYRFLKPIYHKKVGSLHLQMTFLTMAVAVVYQCQQH